MIPLRQQLDEAVSAIRKKAGLSPRLGLILGTGLGDASDAIEDAVAIPYHEIPHFPTSTVVSHSGQLILGHLSGQPVVAMKGRVHFYEGYTMQQVTFPIRVMRALGAEILVASNAVGGMNPLFDAGDIVCITDHINLMGDNPLIGANDDTLGPRFPDMSEPYDKGLMRLAERVALDEKIKLQKGVFVAVAGPNLETRAEYRFLRALGADVVGMSLVPETIVAVHGGMRVLAFSVVTDACLPDALEAVDIERILATAARAEPVLSRLVSAVLKQI
ncbi:MAG: purine-nucleoside phosphorylase [Candidatus Eisenbacteria bacterium]|nr:purine-nucleoside phosphorylase [Candidatus Eisenbacteria bacterium]